MLKGLAYNLVVVNFVLLCLSGITLAARFYVRILKTTVHWDDYLMLIGMVLFVLTVAMSTVGAFHGLGVHHYGASAAQMQNGIMYYTFWQIFYVSSTAPVKASVCVSLSRITPEITYKRVLWGLIAASTISPIIACIVVFTTCHPVAFTWDKTIPGGTCSSLDMVINLSYLVSGVNIITDWTCALMPVIILWRVQMRSRVKITVCLILSMGVFASTATLVRLKTIPFYRNTNDYLYGLAEIAIWSAIEIGVAIIAGSLATLKPLFDKIFSSISDSKGERENTTGPRDDAVRVYSIPLANSGSKGYRRSDETSERRILFDV